MRNFVAHACARYLPLLPSVATSHAAFLFFSLSLQFQSTWWSVLLLSARGANCVVSQDVPCTEKEQVDVVAEYAEQLRGGASVASSVAAVRSKALPLDEALKQSSAALFLNAVRGGCVVTGAVDLKYE